MTRKEIAFTLGMVVLAALLLANLLRPGTPSAYTLPEPHTPVAISAAGDSAWAIIGNKVYFLSLRTAAELPNRTVYQIDSKEIR